MSFRTNSGGMLGYPTEQMAHDDGILSEQDQKYITDFFNTFATEEPLSHMMDITHHNSTGIPFSEIPQTSMTTTTTRGFSSGNFGSSFDTNVGYSGTNGYIYQPIGSASITIPANNTNNYHHQQRHHQHHQQPTSSSSSHIHTEPNNNINRRQNSPSSPRSKQHTLRRTPSRRKSIKRATSSTTPNRGGRGKKGHHELLTEAEKKANHIASEQKRRQNIRLGFDQLVEIVPTLSQCHRKISPEIQHYIDQMFSRISGNSSSFLQGFLLGQLTIVVLVIAFIKFMLLEEASTIQKRPSPTSATLLNSQTANVPPASIILSKTSYDLKYRTPESTDWLNVLLAQVIHQYREDAKTDNLLVRFVDQALNEKVKPDFVGPIEVTKLEIGEEYPIFSNARIRPTEIMGEIDCDFNDQITIGINTQILINWPKPRIAVLPISLALSVIKFSATINLEIDTDSDSSYIVVSVLPEFTLEFDIQSLIGSRSKLEDIPKVTQIITSKLRNIFSEKFVHPNSMKIELPPLNSTI
ncbi:4029_t:CDS:2 [Diversispora eburnea]|uniref:Maintenance of mitochondrial morphology protein 1 n=2 Tax=Diversisporales TaxID=214509 RepID=A0A9N9AVR8_9GLOM|nr:4029_t:CDS:2 [Diversispora eburnea]